MKIRIKRYKGWIFYGELGDLRLRAHLRFWRPFFQLQLGRRGHNVWAPIQLGVWEPPRISSTTLTPCSLTARREE